MLHWLDSREPAVVITVLKFIVNRRTFFGIRERIDGRVINRNGQCSKVCLAVFAGMDGKCIKGSIHSWA